MVCSRSFMVSHLSHMYISLEISTYWHFTQINKSNVDQTENFNFTHFLAPPTFGDELASLTSDVGLGKDGNALTHLCLSHGDKPTLLTSSMGQSVGGPLDNANVKRSSTNYSNFESKTNESDVQNSKRVKILKTQILSTMWPSTGLSLDKPQSKLHPKLWSHSGKVSL
jgi:hypothetical protein